MPCSSQNSGKKCVPLNCHQTLERYVDAQGRDAGAYDLEANLTLLKLYQFNPTYFSLPTVAQILLKALTNLPHSDFMQCKSLLSQENLEQVVIVNIQYLSDLLEKCQFKAFWNKVRKLSFYSFAHPLAIFCYVFLYELQ